MKLDSAINFLNSQSMFKNPLPREKFNFLSKSQFEKLRSSGLIKAKKVSEATSKTNWNFVEITLYYV